MAIEIPKLVSKENNIIFELVTNIELAVKTTIKAPSISSFSPVKTGNATSIQRKVQPNLFSTRDTVQRKLQAGTWLHQKPQKPVNRRPLIQPKVKVHAANDFFEKEADRVADRVTGNAKGASTVTVSNIANGAQRKCASCEAEEKNVQAMHIQRKCASCEEKESVQAKTRDSNFPATNTFSSSDSSPPGGNTHIENHPLDTVLANQTARGSPLPPDARTYMESRMGADFGNVRIHTSSQSHDASAAIGARAFTNGANIHFANGEYNPKTKTGRHLLAHELTHTLQQGAASTKPAPSNPSGITGLRKVVPKAKHEKKIARLSSPHDNKDGSRKSANKEFTKKFKGKKIPKLPGDLLKKADGKKIKKEPVNLPKKEEKKKQDKPAKAAVRVNHLQNAKNEQSQLGGLAAGGIHFKPAADKQDEEDPVQKNQKLQSKRISEGVLAKAAASATSVAAFLSQVRVRLGASANNSISRVKANEMVQKEKIKTSIKEQKDAAKKAMQQAAGSISGYHAKVTKDIKAAVAKARADILSAKSTNITEIEAAALLQIPKIDTSYVEAKKDFEASGRLVGNECYSRQSQRSWNEFISKMKHEDDNWYDGPYTDDIKQAKGDAAIKVGEGYKDGITKAGVEQAAEIDKGKPNDYKKVADAKAEMLKGVNDSYDTSSKAIEASEKSGLSQADSTKKSMLASVYSQHKAAQTKLDVTQKTQTQLAEILSLKQNEQIELQSAQAIDAMEEGGYQNLGQLNKSFKEYKQVCESMNSPPPALLQQKLQPIEASLSGSAPAMIASLQKGMAVTEAGFNKTANETIGTTNTTVTESLTEAKATNDKAIEGLRKLQSAAVTALQGIFNKNKKVITETASQCVTDIQNIKTAFDGSLTQIGADLTSGLKTGSEELKKGLQGAVDNGTKENKSMLDTSKEEEEKAADQVEPRWKSVVKVLLVIAVILVVALVVGPAVIGFISAAAGGGAFGAAVGAVVGGAILGAGSSAVITIGNNLIDGKTWYKGVGAAMLEGAITGAIGGAFGAAGSGLAGKLIGQAAKGVGPALGRFGISQTVDFAGNVVSEYASSKLQGKPFSWTSVAQGQATGAAMHVGMGGLGSLKDVKGFKTVNNVMESSAKVGEKLGGSVKAKFGGAPKVEVPATSGKPALEEPLNKGPAELEVKKPAAKEELPVSKPAEESLPASKSKEDPITTAPKEEVPASKPLEEPKSVPKEEVAQQKSLEENKPANLTQEEINDGIAAKHPTEDGHNMKVTEGGMLVKCSTCEIIDFVNNPYKEVLPPTKKDKFAKEWDAIQKEPNAEIKAKKAAEFDAKLNKEIDSQLSEGGKTAKKLGLPPAEKGTTGKTMVTEILFILTILVMKASPGFTIKKKVIL